MSSIEYWLQNCHIVATTLKKYWNSISTFENLLHQITKLPCPYSVFTPSSPYSLNYSHIFTVLKYWKSSFQGSFNQIPKLSQCSTVSQERLFRSWKNGYCFQGLSRKCGHPVIRPIISFNFTMRGDPSWQWLTEESEYLAFCNFRIQGLSSTFLAELCIFWKTLKYTTSLHAANFTK